MENENQEQVIAHTEQKSTLHQVTPLSKYLAMVLFIILPFVGGYVGYSFAPVKIVEVEKYIEVKNIAQESVPSENVAFLDAIVPIWQYQPITIDGKTLGGELNNPYIFSFDDDSFYIQGEVKYSVTDGTFEQFLTEYGMFRGWIKLDNKVFALTPVDLASWQLSEMPAGLDVSSFELLGSDYAKDSKNIYYQEKILADSNVGDFELVTSELLGNYSVAVSNSNVYYKGELLENISSETFNIGEVTDGTTKSFYIQDGSVFYINHPVCTFEKLERGNQSDVDNYNPVCSR